MAGPGPPNAMLSAIKTIFEATQTLPARHRRLEDSRLHREFLRFAGTRVITLVLTLAAAAIFDLVLGARVSVSPLSVAAGIGLILATKFSDYQCVRALLSAGGTFYGKPPTSVVMGGPYRIVRNPLYLSLFVDTVGLFFIFSSAGLGIALFLQVVGVHFVVVLREEKHLTERFGENYLRYKNAVPRWIPRRQRSLQRLGQLTNDQVPPVLSWRARILRSSRFSTVSS
jgi:protein-S-isoprenylcysteine O-methyltransferase Ste14